VKSRIAPSTFAAVLAVIGSQGLLLAAFAGAGRLAGMAAAAGCALVWLVLVALAMPGISACFCASLALGVLAAMAGAPALLATAAAGASLAAWDLSLLAAGRGRRADEPEERPFLASRLRALAIGIFPGVALAALLGRARLDIPFLGMLAIPILVLIALDRAARRWGNGGG
jgi:hypothetical protein